MWFETHTVCFQGKAKWSCLKNGMGVLLSASGAGKQQWLTITGHMVSLPVPYLDSEWTWELKKMASWREQQFGMGENNSRMKYKLWMDACLPRLARNGLLWHYICFLCLFFSKGKEKQVSAEDKEMNVLAQMEGKEHMRQSRGSWERGQWRLRGHRHGWSLDFPASLGEVPDQHWPPARI